MQRVTMGFGGGDNFMPFLLQIVLKSIHGQHDKTFYVPTVNVIVTPRWLKSSMQKLRFTYKGLKIILDL